MEKTENMQNDAQPMKVYEVGYHLLSSIPEEKLHEEVANIKAVIEKNGGAFIAEEHPKMRALAYTMVKEVSAKRTKYDHAYFGWIKFELSSDKLHEVKEAMEANTNVLRYLLIKTVRENTLVSPKLTSTKSVEDKPEKKDEKPQEEKAPASEAEIDKKIDDLITAIE